MNAVIIATVVITATLTTANPAGAATRTSTKTLLSQIALASQHPAGYARTRFKLWDDADHDSCNTRYEVLIAEASPKPHVGAGCRLTGGKWTSPYDGVTTTNPTSFDIDHLVPLAEAWQSGAYRWTAKTRESYANDLGYGPDLVAVSAHANRSKGDKEPSGYLPPKASFRCTYEAWWVAVKWRWHLTIDSAEKSWLTSHLKACGWPTVTKPSRPAIGTTTGTGSGGGSATSGAAITAIYFDSPGADTGSNTSRNAEWVQIKNTTGTAKKLTGWTLRDASSHKFTFPTFTLGAGKVVKVHTGTGSNTSANLYWGNSGYIWNNTGDTATLRNTHGTTIDKCSYTSAADPEANC